MSSSGSLDTNVLLRFIIGDIKSQYESALALLKSSPGQLTVSDMVFAEIVFVLEKGYGMSRQDIVIAITHIIDLPNINCNQMLLIKASSYYAHSPSLSFADCYLAANAELNETEPLYTFDKKLANQLPSAKLLVS